MSKKNLTPLIIPAILVLMCLASIKKDGHPDKTIMFTGHFYAWIPYQITCSEDNPLELKADTNRIFINPEQYGDKTKSSFWIKREGEHSLTIYDSLSRQHILFKMKAKNPSLTIEFSSMKGGIPYASGKTIGIKKILEGGGLQCIVSNFDINLTLPVKQFEMVFYANNELKTIHSKGSKPILSEEQKEAISQIKESTILIFRNIIVKTYSGEEIEAPPFIFLLEV